jgi:alpha-1,2-mannosyltransferase
MSAPDDGQGAATRQRSIAPRRPSLAYVILASVVGALIWLRWGGIRKGIWVDLDVYMRGATAVIRREPLYSVSVHGLPFTYPPFAAVLYVPLDLLGAIGARWVLTVVSISCYVVVLVVCARRLRMSLAIAALIGLAGLTFEPFLRTILLGQINLLLLALVVIDCLVVPARYRGMLVGLATGIKILPGSFILFLILKREWGAVCRAAAVFAVTVGVGAMFAPHDSWLFWRGGFINLSRFGTESIIGGDNQSLSAAFMRLSHDISPPTILVLLMSVGAMTLGVVAAKAQIDTGNDVNGLVCIAFGSMLASPISWTHHWVWAVLAMLVLVQAGRRVAAVVLGAVFVIGPMWLTPRGQFLELNDNWWQAAACVSYLVIGLAYLVFFAVSGQRFGTVHSAPDRHQPNG